MSEVIFEYFPDDTNWLNPAWRKAKMKELDDMKKLSDIMNIEIKFPEVSLKERAKIFGCSPNWYCQLRKKYNVKEILKCQN